MKGDTKMKSNQILFHQIFLFYSCQTSDNECPVNKGDNEIFLEELVSVFYKIINI